LRVLDLGCGPGSNAGLFENADYLGIDINVRYVKAARKSYPNMRFEVGDICHLYLKESGFDVILINSLLHHLSDCEVSSLLVTVSRLLSLEGKVIIQDALVPRSFCWIPRLLRSLDRGKYYRDEGRWRSLFESNFVIESGEPYKIRLFGITSWYMVSWALGKRGLIQSSRCPGKGNKSGKIPTERREHGSQG
jgi:SAM-dependent methyltransferase